MSRLDLDARRLGRLLRSLSTAGMVIVEENEADRSVRTARPPGAGPADHDRRSDKHAVSILRRLNPPQRDRLLAAMAEVVDLLAAPTERPSRDDLSEELAEMGYRIAQHGPAADPRARLLADALRAAEPVAAAVLASPAEPDVARARAFLHLARAAAHQPQPQRDSLTAALART